MRATSQSKRFRIILVLLMASLFVWKLCMVANLSQREPPLRLGPLPNHTSTKSRFAYASLIGGVDPTQKTYRGFFYNVLVAARLLDMFGSTADFVVLVQLSHDTSYQELPPQDLAILKRLGIQVEYIPKSPHQSFYEITLEKFRILAWTHYERVLFLDADVMPLANLDYLFEMSTGFNATLRENLVVAGTHEPSTAGFFLLTPQPGAMATLQRILWERERRARDLPFPKFNPILGWGHVLRPPDRWETTDPRHHGTNWTFYAADADQGLLYHYAKYARQTVSIAIGDIVQNWGPGPDGLPRLERVLRRPFSHTGARLAKWATGPPPYRHFHHFTGRSKPWEGGVPHNLSQYNRKKTPEHFWFHHLFLIHQELNLSGATAIDWEAERRAIGKPPLGRFHGKEHMAQRVDRTNHKMADIRL